MWQNPVVDIVLRELTKRLKTQSLRSLSGDLGCSHGYLSEIMAGDKRPGPKVLEALGFERKVTTTVVYKRKANGNAASLR